MGTGRRQQEFETRDEVEKKFKGYHFTHLRTMQSTGVKWKFFIRLSAHPNVLMTYNELEERNQCSVGTLLTPVETGGA
jgi:hypothetical protein